MLHFCKLVHNPTASLQKIKTKGHNLIKMKMELRLSTTFVQSSMRIISNNYKVTEQRASYNLYMCYVCCFFMSKVKAMVISGRSIFQTRLFLGRLTPPKQLNSTKYPYFCQLLTTALLVLNLDTTCDRYKTCDKQVQTNRQTKDG